MWFFSKFLSRKSDNFIISQQQNILPPLMQPLIRININYCYLYRPSTNPEICRWCITGRYRFHYMQIAEYVQFRIPFITLYIFIKPNSAFYLRFYVSHVSKYEIFDKYYNYRYNSCLHALCTWILFFYVSFD